MLNTPVAVASSSATIQFVSDGSVVKDGFNASFHCAALSHHATFSSLSDINSSSLGDAIDAVPANDTGGMLLLISDIAEVLNNASAIATGGVNASAARDQLLDAFARTSAVYSSDNNAHQLTAASNVIAALTEVPEQLTSYAVVSDNPPFIKPKHFLHSFVMQFENSYKACCCTGLSIGQYRYASRGR